MKEEPHDSIGAHAAGWNYLSELVTKEKNQFIAESAQRAVVTLARCCSNENRGKHEAELLAPALDCQATVATHVTAL